MHAHFDHWPLLLVDLEDDTDGAGGNVFYEALVAALGRQAPFALVAVMPRELPAERRPHDTDQMRWLKSNRPRLAECCRGMAFVMTREAREQYAKAVESGPKIYGCATEAFERREAAVAWARGRLATTDAATVRA
jgi:hypothetical protein